MPINADPNDTAPFYLRHDLGKPIESRPAFMVRFLNEVEHRKVRRLMLDAGKNDDPDAAADIVEEAIRVGVVGCKNIVYRGKPVDFSQIKRFGEYLSPTELAELAWGQLKAISASEEDRFFSESQRCSEQDKSAPDANTAAK